MNMVKDEEFRKLVRENADLKEKLKKSQEHDKALNGVIKDLTLVIREMEGPKNFLENEVERLNKTINYQEEEIGELKESLEELRAKTAIRADNFIKVVEENNELKADLETARSFDNRDILKQLRVTQNSLNERIKEKNRLWNQLLDAEDACQKKDDCINILKDKLVNITSSLEDSEASKEQYKKESDTFQRLYSQLSKVIDEKQTLVNSLLDDKLKLKKDQEYLLNRVKKAEARVDELIKENNELHAQSVFNTVDLDDCEELEADYIPGANIECKIESLTINNWFGTFEGDEEDEEE